VRDGSTNASAEDFEDEESTVIKPSGHRPRPKPVERNSISLKQFPRRLILNDAFTTHTGWTARAISTSDGPVTRGANHRAVIGGTDRHGTTTDSPVVDRRKTAPVSNPY
jgi:hypothetical protein